MVYGSERENQGEKGGQVNFGQISKETQQRVALGNRSVQKRSERREREDIVGWEEAA